MADKELYGALSDVTKAQEIWKGRKAEFPKNKKLRKKAERVVKILDVADKAIEEALPADKEADAEYDKEKEKVKA